MGVTPNGSGSLGAGFIDSHFFMKPLSFWLEKKALAEERVASLRATQGRVPILPSKGFRRDPARMAIYSMKCKRYRSWARKMSLAKARVAYADEQIQKILSLPRHSHEISV